MEPPPDAPDLIALCPAERGSAELRSILSVWGQMPMLLLALFLRGSFGFLSFGSCLHPHQVPLPSASAEGTAKVHHGLVCSLTSWSQSASAFGTWIRLGKRLFGSVHPSFLTLKLCPRLIIAVPEKRVSCPPKGTDVMGHVPLAFAMTL